ncbi:DUF4347 domain-containing protein, partial [Spiribacter sp. SSL99]|uniref:DUF4347 domain-containing protein n=1 Tax=Spiribacter sp. SSL99 TaxID=1866884 RepID=UPI0013308439
MDTSDKREALIIDASVEQMDTLLEGLNSSVRAPRSIARDDDPAQSIRHFLDDPSVTSLHVLGHGRPGGVRIGSRWLTADDFRVGADTAAARPEPLEIYFWSCHTGADAAGKTFMQNIAEHSMANVFASTDLIGDKDQGGNWELNASATPRAAVPFSQEARDAFGVVLAVTKDSGTGDDPSFTEGGSRQSIYSSIGLSADNNIKSFSTVITGVSDTGKETFRIDGVDVSLTDSAINAANGTSGSVGVDFDSENSTSTVTWSSDDQTSGATPSDVAAILNALEYENTSDDPSDSPRVFSLGTFTETDNAETNLSLESTVSITPVNDAPSGTDKTVTVNEDATYTLQASDFGFSDTADSDAFASVVIATLPSAGSLKLDGS